MKTAFIGVRHGHAKHYCMAVNKLSKYKIVGISNPNKKLLGMAMPIGTQPL
jgi:predicted dehydrogenase